MATFTKKTHVKATDVKVGDVLSILSDRCKVKAIEECTDNGWSWIAFDFEDGTSYHAGYEDYLLNIN